jgi:Mrp family chromosome partitioning ATPase
MLLPVVCEQAEVILFDSAPVVAVSDDLHLASLVDGVVLVVRSGVTRRRALTRAKARLDRANARVLGVVVNGLSPRETRRYYADYAAYVSRPGVDESHAARRRWPFGLHRRSPSRNRRQRREP